MCVSVSRRRSGVLFLGLRSLFLFLVLFVVAFLIVAHCCPHCFCLLLGWCCCCLYCYCLSLSVVFFSSSSYEPAREAKACLHCFRFFCSCSSVFLPCISTPHTHTHDLSSIVVHTHTSSLSLTHTHTVASLCALLPSLPHSLPPSLSSRLYLLCSRCSSVSISTIIVPSTS